MQFEHLDHQRTVDVFFYGLFMDEALLRHKGVNPLNRRIACVDNFGKVYSKYQDEVPAIVPFIRLGKRLVAT